MYSVSILILIGLVLIVIWLSVITWIVLKEKNLKDRLFPPGSEGIDKDAYSYLTETIEKLKSAVSELYKKDESQSKYLRELAKDGLHHIQKIKLSRYNPYNDTGGDQSFTIVLLTGNSDGILITSLHSRAGTRVYAKTILSGKSDIELSKEEKEVLESALQD